MTQATTECQFADAALFSYVFLF